MSVADDVERAVAPVVSSLGLELVDLESRPGHVIVTIDREGGLDLEAIGGATRAISSALDVADAIPNGRYELEVSSPGVERRLRRPEDFARFVGAEVAVRLRPGSEGVRRFSGVLTAADDDAIVVSGPGLPAGGRRVAHLDLERVHTVFDWRAALAGTSSPARREDRARAGSSRPRSGPATETRTES
jgi:ribosome maturation factor RimP